MIFPADDIRSRYAITDEYPLPWARATREDFDRLSAQYPESFRSFQIDHAERVPCPVDGFGWATPGLEPYECLESLIADARAWGVADTLSPFVSDEGNFYCFDTAQWADDETPVVFWDHEGGDVLDVPQLRWESFVAWYVDTVFKSMK